jgi:hypothetical protein
LALLKSKRAVGTAQESSWHCSRELLALLKRAVGTAQESCWHCSRELLELLKRAVGTAQNVEPPQMLSPVEPPLQRPLIILSPRSGQLAFLPPTNDINNKDIAILLTTTTKEAEADTLAND